MSSALSSVLANDESILTIFTALGLCWQGPRVSRGLSVSRFLWRARLVSGGFPWRLIAEAWPCRESRNRGCSHMIRPPTKRVDNSVFKIDTCVRFGLLTETGVSGSRFFSVLPGNNGGCGVSIFCSQHIRQDFIRAWHSGFRLCPRTWSLEGVVYVWQIDVHGVIPAWKLQHCKIACFWRNNVLELQRI